MHSAHSIPLFIGLLLFLTGCQKNEETHPMEPVVAVIEAKSDQALSRQSYTGQIRARHEVNLAFRVAGKISERLVEVGDQVRAGQVLAKLEPIDYRLAVEAAESELVAAKAAQERTQKDELRLRALLQTQAISASEYEISKSAADSTAAQVQRAERMLELSQRRLAYCDLIADSDSVVSQLFVDTGSVVAEGSPVFRLAQLGELEAVIDIPENRIDVARTLQASVTTWAEQGDRFDAKLRETSPYADPNTRTYQTRFSILEPSEHLRLGMTAKVELAEIGQSTSFRLPPTALVLRDGST